MCWTELPNKSGDQVLKTFPKNIQELSSQIMDTFFFTFWMFFDIRSWFSFSGLSNHSLECSKGGQHYQRS